MIENSRRRPDILPIEAMIYLIVYFGETILTNVIDFPLLCLAMRRVGLWAGRTFHVVARRESCAALVTLPMMAW